MLKAATIFINLLVLLLVVTLPSEFNNDHSQAGHRIAAVSSTLNTYLLWRHPGGSFQRWIYAASGLLFLVYCVTVTSYDECLDAYSTRFHLLASSTHQADTHWKMLDNVGGYAALGGIVVEVGLVVFVLVKAALQRKTIKAPS